MATKTKVNGNGKNVVVELELPFFKATKNTFVFADENAVIPSLYIQQRAFPKGKQPEKVKVTVEATYGD